jgi:hypothetical protein
MQNDLEIGAELQRLASDDPLNPVDVTGLLERGRRGRRRRRIGSVTGLAAGVAVIGVGAALVPGIVRAHREPEVAATAQALFTPMPGVPQGEAALGNLSQKEAERRCTVRYGVRPLAKFDPRVYRATMGIMSPLSKKNDLFGPGCIVPGDSKPTAEASALAKADPVPQTADGQLRNCSVQFWHDLTKWRVVTTERVEGALGNKVLRLLAVSPTGRSAVSCGLPLSAESAYLAKVSRPSILTAQTERLVPLSDVGATNYGRVDLAIARIQVKSPTGATHDVTVTNGWFSLYAPTDDLRNATLTAYDASGQVIKTVKSIP